MNKTQTRAWLKRMREAIADAEKSLKEDDGAYVLDCMADILGSASEVQMAWEDTLDERLGR